ncbi:fibroblast growth factor receptor substrate 3-like isoform X2 [Anneissia japonica]|nr:fibroblast growth factor receptor substrate 3-like isoform X2 [Anneissia japonica]XP_033114861.1 fibroblast growth factor receptor substrate 3-like isoform X2 [Anneissia japonica]XP_033114868.1 fibroblast growth factor receptor substrate 3-like isoform X2 [Anneissia japonica]XP_033114875.1 fibroblast growth factor receptor substrate 3-like isoform X2 [Anneissia japonica]XP_033114882.1 fibroblast growth factor receptor substrate 3-like isoform X2 [Anneissia japonica]XP_033114889.1 fibroblast
MGNLQCVHPEGDMKYPPNMFKVKNVDDDGETVSKGLLEVGKTELTLHQRGKDMISWPLRSLRRYGFDSDLFSFESGRRCPTGQGIYAFKCKKAQMLFNELQANIQCCGDNPNNHQPAQFMLIGSNQPLMGNSQNSPFMNGFESNVPRPPPSPSVTYINAQPFTLMGNSTSDLQASGQTSGMDTFRRQMTSHADGGSYAALKENTANDNTESAMLNYAHLRLSEDEEGAIASGHSLGNQAMAECNERGTLYNTCSCDVTDSGVICQKSETASRSSNNSITDDLDIRTRDENGNKSKFKVKKTSPKPKMRKFSDVVNGNVHLNGNHHMAPTPGPFTPVVASPVPGVYVNLDTIGELPSRSAFAFADLPTPRSAASRGSNGSEFVFDALHTCSSRSPGGPNYANLDGLEPTKRSCIIPDSLKLQAPPKKKINYIELDLDSLEATRNERANARSSTSSSPKTPQTPNLDPRGPYAMIDIDRTIALSNTQRQVEDDSNRRTRHDRGVLPKLT